VSCQTSIAEVIQVLTTISRSYQLLRKCTTVHYTYSE